MPLAKAATIARRAHGPLMNGRSRPRDARPRWRRHLAIAAGMAGLGALAPAGSAGPFPPAAGRPGSDAMAADDPRFVGWAIEVTELIRGPEEIDDPDSPMASYGTKESALGRADVIGHQDQPEPGSPLPKPAVSLGDGGSITLRFDPPIADGPGPDFAVFENGISFNGATSFFMEIAFVEASSDGTTFVRFPAFSETPSTAQISGYAALDPTNLHNLAGKYMAGFGTPFDLDDLAGAPGLDLQAVTHLRIIDVVGSIDPRYARHDSLGRVINDPWPTFLTTSGFDLDVVGVIHQHPGGYAHWSRGFSWSEADADPAADPDGDGLPNLLEYALDLSPLVPQPAPPISLFATAEGWVATPPPLRPTTPDLVITLETSPDLRTWTPHPVGQVVLGAAGGPPAFCRLHIHRLPAP